MKKEINNLSGEIVTTVTGVKYKLGKVLGCGSQGVVYEEDSGSKVVKLYYPVNTNASRECVIDRLLFIKNTPLPSNFVRIIDVFDFPYVGYVMEKIVDYKSLNSYLIPNKSISFSEWYNGGRGFRTRLLIGYVIAKTFSELESKNLSYCDISGNNILVKIESGLSVKMIDVDNIYIAGKSEASVLGTPRYIAPEVASGEKNPDVLSDNYSLAVILYELLRVGHPYISDVILEGTPEDEENALAGKSEYVTDENSTYMLPSDVVLTSKLKTLFKQCFVDGKNNRMKRPSAKEFEHALLEAGNNIIQCPSCGAWHYPRVKGKVYENCPWCEGESKPEAWLNFYDVLYNGDNYKSETDKISTKPIVSYMLHLGKNEIRSYYILRTDGPAKTERTAEKYFTIGKIRGKWCVYNEFSKTGIVLRRHETGEYHILNNEKFLEIKNNDCIFFEMDDEKGCSLEIGGQLYSFIRVAKFVEGEK